MSEQSNEPKTPQTLTEKILQRATLLVCQKGKLVRSGDYVQIRPHRCLSHDNTWPIAQKFMSGPPNRLLLQTFHALEFNFRAFG